MKFILSFILLLSLKAFSQFSTNQRLELKRLELENKYGYVERFDTLTGIAVVYKDMKMGYIDTTGKIIYPIGEYVTRPFFDGFGICEKMSGIVAINKFGKIIKEYPNLLSHSNFEKGVALVTEKKSGRNKYGIVDSKGNKLIECKYEYIEKISENYYYVNNNETGAGILNKFGDTIIPLIYNIDYFDTTNQTFIGYKADLGYAIFDSLKNVRKFLGKEVNVESPSIEGKAYFQRDSVIIVKNQWSSSNAKTALVNLSFDTIIVMGKYKLANINEGMVSFYESVIVENIDNRVKTSQITKYGFLNTKGEIIIPSRFDFGQYFTEGLSAVQINNKWGYINKVGKIVIPLKFDYALPFRNGFAKIKMKDKFYIIDKKGKIVLNSKSY
jgi:hypothetical protein